ncbi:MAG: universal stress protein [Candidatus Nitrosotenuis sp.]
MFSKILVAIDGSRSAKRAFTRSIYLAGKCNSMLDVVHVVPCEFGGDSAKTFELVEELKVKASDILEECKRIAVKNNISIKTSYELGDPAKIIIGLANSKDYDLVVMGSRGRSAFKELLLGSVALKVAHHAKCPIMVVR